MKISKENIDIIERELTRRDNDKRPGYGHLNDAEGVAYKNSAGKWVEVDATKTERQEPGGDLWYIIEVNEKIFKMVHTPGTARAALRVFLAGIAGA